jgi:transposase
MEDVLDIYLEPHDPQTPVVCLDEMPVGLVDHAREPLPAQPGKTRKEDYEYVRGGSATVFGALDLKGGRRLLEVSPRRAKEDFARFVKRVVDELCAGAERVRLVLDNLSTHSKAALYEAFPPEEAMRLCKKLEFHYTPKHGSWLNAVELEFAACHKQCVGGKRLGGTEELCQTIRAWQDERNEARATVRWTFDVPAARQKLHRIYPKNEA